MNIVINNIIDDDNELFNRVRAIGPGDGINRMMYVVEDASSIAAYGVREKVQEFPSVTTYSELQTQADALLATIKDPVKEIEFTYYFDSSLYSEDVTFNGEIVTYGGSPVTQLMPGSMLDMVRGDEVRVVSQSLGLSFTGVIDELDWSLGKVNVRLGQPYYNLIDVINGPDRDRKRVDEALRLPAPIGVSAVTGAPGVNITINPYTNSRIVGTEIYADTSEGFTPDRSTLLLRSQDTRFEFPALLGGVTYYFKLRSYDNEGNVSGFTTATADGGFIPTTKFRVDNVVIDDTGSSDGRANAVRVYDGTGFAAEDEAVRMGYINGLSGVPSGINYGFWGTAGTNVFIKGVPRIVKIIPSIFLFDLTFGGYPSPVDIDLLDNGSVYQIEPSPFTIPPGYERSYIPIVTETNLSGNLFEYYQWFYTFGTNAGTTGPFSIGPGTYNYFDVKIEVLNISGTQASPYVGFAIVGIEYEI